MNFETQAKNNLTPDIYDFIIGGAGDESTIKNNRNALDDIKLIPHVLQGVSQVDLQTVFNDMRVDAFVGFSPTAFHELVVKEGELTTVKCAKNHNIPMIVSMMSNKTLESIATIWPDGNLAFQIYPFKDRKITYELIKRAELAGYKQIVLTVDLPVMGIRPRDLKNQFRLPSQLVAANLVNYYDTKQMTIHDFVKAQHDPMLNWSIIEEIKKITKLPICVKGILNPKDAKEAVQWGADSIIVSNHGGRQLESAVSPIEILPQILDVVKTIPVAIDSGFRSGTDVFKAIAMGADMVFLGRSVLIALAAEGEVGLNNFCQLIKNQLQSTMTLCGCKDIIALKGNRALITSPILDRMRLESKIDKILTLMPVPEVTPTYAQEFLRKKNFSI